MELTIKPLVHTALSLLLFSLAGPSYAQVPQIERDALVTLYNSTDGANWTDNTGWMGAVGTECSWSGVTCTNGSVSRLWFWTNGLNGTIPSELGNLSNLTSLNLGNNSLSGTIPSELGNLKNLTFFNIGGNSLSGSIPAELGNLVYLTNFNVRDNNLSGEIPNELGGIKNLTYLDLWGENSFTGSIPREWEKREVLIDQGTRYIDHNNHFIDDVDRDGIDDAIDKDAGSPAKIKTIETADYSISILGSGRVVNLVSNSKYQNEFRDIQRGGNGSRLASSTVKLITNILFKHFEDEFDFIMIASGCSKIRPCVENNGGAYGTS